MSYSDFEEKPNKNTIYVGNIDFNVSEELLWKIFIDAGPIVNINLPKDSDNKRHKGYGFVEYDSKEGAEYALKIYKGVKLNGRKIHINKPTKH
ncbi:splicing factor 3B subunit 4-like isoform X2 [Teleopsis dalmanni]|uniref:splicing factor 3B subunit 4-like isoform X2 n=1 Tax=Teleopsis dalmanni TaxID=139649 RepID=UPI0018CFE24D|nr:splicing factor 3B subunit 4-like isoform X2 [Teleopsis dalmanni]